MNATDDYCKESMIKLSSCMHNIGGKLVGAGESGPAHQRLLQHEKLSDSKAIRA